MPVIDAMDRPEPTYRPTAAGLVRWAADRYGDREFIVLADQKVSYRDFEARSRDLAKQLVAAGVGKGTRVAIQFGNSIEFAVAWFAAGRIGAVVVPLSTFYAPSELRKVLRLADIQLLLTPRMMMGRDQHGFLEEAIPGLAAAQRGSIYLDEPHGLRAVWIWGESDKPWATPFSVPAAGVTGGNEVPDSVIEAIEAEVYPADVLTIIHTSGTTADPKGVIHTNGTIMRQGWNHTIWWDITRDVRVFTTMAWFWIGGLGQWLLPVMSSGGAILVQEKPDPGAAVKLIVNEKANRIAGYAIGPVMAHPDFAAAEITDGLREFLAFAARTHLRGSSFGMSETGAIHSTSDWFAEVPPEERGNGRAVRGMEHRIVDPETGKELPEGEIGTLWVRGHQLMVGLNKRERENTFELDGWYDTADRGLLRDGVFFFHGRNNEMIRTSGANVAPVEVEAVLVRQPDVMMAAVLGVDDPQREQSVAAAIAVAAGVEVDLADLAKRLRADLSAYKVPRRWLVISAEEFPTLANGKPDRRGIAAMLAERSREL
ncbi:MAG: class I adenylate-forming enzyme family protein [Acidimicrobiia bacterium]